MGSGGGGGGTGMGGAGQDVFLFQNLDEFGVDGLDMITDFENGDLIDLSGIDANTSASGDQAFSWTSSFTGQAGQIRMVGQSTPGSWLIEFDINGDALADASFIVQGAASPSSGWIL
ncbi:MAG: hypothetical protein B7Y86_04240 [Brevundimonas subvibrioides]|uniref:Peptidase M10 serralysin C-terminal domain-containing protein n=1 Tax=Brevundimonas subvibrioides TaxID=74313 RepID=A0A258HMG0_9CAUL|nr:MAG: hypothetical protein B7Y86_04240 [Brevundimonas subvibrioides]